MPSPHSFAIELGELSGADLEVRVRGELDMSTAPELSSTLLAAAGQGAQSLTLDLRGVTFLDSSAIGALIATGHELRERGQLLRIGPRSGVVARILDITGLTRGSDALDVQPEQE